LANTQDSGTSLKPVLWMKCEKLINFYPQILSKNPFFFSSTLQENLGNDKSARSDILKQQSRNPVGRFGPKRHF
jgi:hypothetical protein